MNSYILAPWQLVAEEGMAYWSGPSKAVGCVDLATVPQMAEAIDPSRRGFGLFVIPGILLPSSDYVLLGRGDAREISLQPADRAALRQATGHRPNADTLAEAVWECLTDGADPSGDAAPKPIMPGHGGACSLFLGEKVRHGHFRLRDNSPHRDRILGVIRRHAREWLDDDDAGRMRKGQSLRALDYLREQYGLDDAGAIEAFLSPEDRKRVRALLKHETTITDAFTDTNGTSLTSHVTGGGWSWAHVASTFAIQGNRARPAANYSVARAQIDLSSADHYSQINYQGTGTLTNAGSAIRYSSAADTHYFSVLIGSGSNRFRIFKSSAGSLTSLFGSATNDLAQGDVCKLEAAGSTLTLYRNGSSRATGTDVAITGNLRTGIYGQSFGGSFGEPEDFEASDNGAVATLKYTQLERDVRGINRGMYTKFGG